MGETAYWDEFLAANGEVIKNARIYFGQSWDLSLERLNKEANSLGLYKVALKSLPGEKYDLKSQRVYYASYGPGTGRLLRGKYATVRSAGNFLAGMNGATGTFMGKHISLELYMRLAGLLHSVSNNFSTNPFSAPYYGEVDYAGRMIVAGYNYGIYRIESSNWLAY